MKSGSEDNDDERQRKLRQVESECLGVIQAATLNGRNSPGRLSGSVYLSTMDFADATLVHLTRCEVPSTIFTIHHADFETYRIEGRRRFRVIPVKRP